MLVKGKDDKLEAGLRASSSSRAIPNDAGGFAYAIMFAQGIGQLFPWNAFITAALYFGQRFCVTNFRYDFENYLSISFTASQTIGLAVSVLYANKLSYHDKIVYPLIIYALLFALTTAFVLVPGIEGNALFWFTLSCCIGCGLAGALLSAGFFSLSGLFPPKYTGAMMSGQGLAGLTVSLTNLITQAVQPLPASFCNAGTQSTPEPCSDYSVNYSAFAYFLISTLVLCLCLVLFFVLMKLPFTIFYLRGAGQLKREVGAVEEPLLEANAFESGPDTPGDDSHGTGSSHYTSKLGLSGILKRNQNQHTLLPDDEPTNSAAVNPILIDKLKVVPFNESRIMANESDHESSKSSKMAESMGITTLGNIMGVFRTIKIPALTVFSVFAVTLGLFPALTITVVSSQHCTEGATRAQNDLFVPILFLLFNLGDFSGRVIAGNTQRTFLTPENIHWAAVARLAFVPLFLMTNISGSQVPTVFTSDAFPVIFMLLLALSNGYVSSCCMMMGPSMVDPSDAPMAGNIMVFLLTSGLMCGSILSFVVTYISQGHM